MVALDGSSGNALWELAAILIMALQPILTDHQRVEGHQKQPEYGMAAYERVTPAMGSVCGFAPAATLIEECRPLVGDTAVAVVDGADSSGKACGLDRARVRSYGLQR